MPIAESWLCSPLAIVDTFFEKDSSLAATAANVSSFFSEKLKDETYYKVPSLNDVPLHHLVSGSLVRFRCVVQDMFDPEFYLGVYEVQCGKSGTARLCTAMFRDVINCATNEEVNFDSPSNVTADRQTLYCVPIPGESKWVKEAYAKICSDTTVFSNNQCHSGVAKRTVEAMSSDCDEDNGAVSSMDTAEAAIVTANVSEIKRSKNASEEIATSTDVSTAATDVSTAVTHNLNFPLPLEKGPACMVKVYGADAANIKLNDVIEVVGILSADPCMATFSQKQSVAEGAETYMCTEFEAMDSTEELAAKNPPPSLVPRVHAVIIRKLAHSNPLLTSSLAMESLSSVTDNIGTLRDETLDILECALLGDRLAAEYFLCHLISSVHGRRDVMALGKFSLNFSGCPRNQSQSFVNKLSDLLASLVTKSHLLKMSLSNLNNLRFVPKKDYASNRLQSGLLQLSDQTSLIVDETAMEPGQLQALGVNNLSALNNVVMWQRLDYDFEYHVQSFFTDVRVLVMSEGKSLLKCDCQVPLVLDDVSVTKIEEKYEGIHTYLTPELLKRIRVYLSHVQLMDYSVPDDVQKIIESDFVEKRRENADNLTVTDFHLLLTLARLLSLGSGETKLTESTWRHALSMESMRAERLKASGSS